MPRRLRVRDMLRATGKQIACGTLAWDYAAGWNQLRYFNNPGGHGTCGAAVERALRSKLNWVMATAYMNGFEKRQPAGIHRKLVIFGSQAMFQGSYNRYPSTANSGGTYDSTLVENGGIIFDPAYVSSQVSAFDEAFALGYHMMGDG